MGGSRPLDDAPDEAESEEPKCGYSSHHTMHFPETGVLRVGDRRPKYYSQHSNRVPSHKCIIFSHVSAYDIPHGRHDLNITRYLSGDNCDVTQSVHPGPGCCEGFSWLGLQRQEMRACLYVTGALRCVSYIDVPWRSTPC